MVRNHFITQDDKHEVVKCIEMLVNIFGRVEFIESEDDYGSEGFIMSVGVDGSSL